MDLMLCYPFNNNTQYDLQVGQKTCQIVDLGNIGEDKKYLYTLILSLSGFIGGLISILIGNIPYIN